MVTDFKSILCKSFTSSQHFNRGITYTLRSDCIIPFTVSFSNHSDCLKHGKENGDTERRKKHMDYHEINLFLPQMCSLAALPLLGRRRWLISPAGASCGPRGKSLMPQTVSVTRTESVKVLLQTSTKVRGTTWCLSSNDSKRQVLHVFLEEGVLLA